MENINAKYIFLGEKDFQQLYLIKKYLKSKHNIKIISCKTIRNKNKLPLSSRNKLLTKSLLNKSEKISKILFNFKLKISKDFRKIKLKKYYMSKISNLCDKIEYFEIRNFNDLSLNISKKNFKLFLAYRQKNIRLIDNF